jgi:hypothetical protein
MVGYSVRHVGGEARAEGLRKFDVRALRAPQTHPHTIEFRSGVPMSADL